ncbi:hypothetical protein CRENBAI_002616 [Crenichthys baileyi]|uniref:Uncharacterized protein n=1 Tax=Crenichthys baileyi TaxID=28760 RepID=A0AAV9R5S5_9TELE
MVDLLICHPKGPLLCSADPQTEGPLLCSADLHTVSSFVAGLLRSCSATAGFLTNLQVPANAGFHGLYVSAGLLVVAGRHGLYVPVGLHVFATSLHGLYASVGHHAFAADHPGLCVAGSGGRLNCVPARGDVLVARLNFVPARGDVLVARLNFVPAQEDLLVARLNFVLVFVSSRDMFVFFINIRPICCELRQSKQFTSCARSYDAVSLDQLHRVRSDG